MSRDIRRLPLCAFGRPVRLDVQVVDRLPQPLPPVFPACRPAGPADMRIAFPRSPFRPLTRRRSRPAATRAAEVLEDRALLSATFALDAEHLQLGGFTQVAHETLVVRENGSKYEFVLTEGLWFGANGGGVTGGGTAILSVDKAAVAGLAGLSSNPLATTQLWDTWADAAWEDVRVGDFDGNGKSDLIGRYQGDWYVSWSDGTRFVTGFYARWADADWRAVGVGELDGAVPFGPKYGPVEDRGGSSGGGSLAAGPAVAASSAETGDPLAVFWSQADRDERLAAGLLAAV
jgi:hypothetical protein